MKVIIEHSKTKRAINGPFNICGSRADLQNIANQILAQIDDDWVYGWLHILENEQKSIADTPPIGWD